MKVAGIRVRTLAHRTTPYPAEIRHALLDPLDAATISLFEPLGGGLAERIRSVKIDELRPIEALQLLADLQKELS